MSKYKWNSGGCCMSDDEEDYDCSQFAITPLHEALNKKVVNVEEIKKCLEQDISWVNEDGNKHGIYITPLMILVKKQNCSFDLVKLLIDYGASVKYEDKKGRTPLLLLLQSGNYSEDIVKLLLGNGASRNKADDNGNTPLSVLLQSDNCPIDIVQLLLDHGAKVNNLYDSGNLYESARSPLMVLLESQNCSFNMVKILIDYGAPVNKISADDPVPLFFLLENENCTADIVKLLLDNGASVDALGCNGCSLLCCALQCNPSASVIKLLLDAGCSTNACRRRGHNSVFHCIIFAPGDPEFNPDILNLLLKAGADLNKVDEQGQSPLCLAMQYGIDIELLLSAGGSLNACTKHPSPLHCGTLQWSRTHLNVDRVKLLHNACLRGSGSWIDKVHDNGYTVVQQVLHCCGYETRALKQLLDFQGVNVINFRNEEDETLLHMALCNKMVHCKPSTLKLFIDLGVQVDQVNTRGEIPLHVAVRNRYSPSIVKMLLKNGSPLNVKDKSGIVPLRAAVESLEDSNIIKMLLVAGAKIGTMKDRHYLLEHALAKICWEREHQSIYYYRKKGNTRTQREIHSQLENDVSQYYNEKRLSDEKMCCFVMLIKYSFIENPSLEINSLMGGRLKFLDFAGKCVQELHKMKSINAGHGRTMFEFITDISLPKMEVADFTAENYDLNQILQLCMENVFPIYFDIILAKVGKLVMLQELLVYTVKNPDNLPSAGLKIVLNYESVCEIAKYLVDEDLLRFVVTFYNRND